jgi:hypothetical protein
VGKYEIGGKVMYKLQYMNVIREVATEIEKDNLIAEGYVLIEDTHTADDSINETSENEISQDADTSEEQSEENADETDEENKVGKKSGKAKK